MGICLASRSSHTLVMDDVISVEGRVESIVLSQPHSTPTIIDPPVHGPTPPTTLPELGKPVGYAKSKSAGNICIISSQDESINVYIHSVNQT